MKHIGLVAFVCLALGAPETVSAQPLGTFRWQLAPFCNVVTVLVEQKGAVYELTGSDDGCNGAAPSATAHGSAHLNTDGSVTLSLAMTRANGLVINAGASLNIVTLSGTWRDDWDNTGTLVFNPASPAGGPPRTLTMRGEYSIIFPATANGHEGGTSISFPRSLPAPPSVSATNLILPGGLPTSNCPGSTTNPQAAPGHLCVYERMRANAVVTPTIYTAATGTANVTGRHGFSIRSVGTGAGNAVLYGTWAVTVP